MSTTSTQICSTTSTAGQLIFSGSSLLNDIISSRDLNNNSHHLCTTRKYTEFNANVVRKTTNEPLGLSFAKKDGIMVVTKVSESGIVAKQTKLKEGDILLGINNAGCSAFTHSGIEYPGLTAKQALDLITSSTTINLRAMRPSSLSVRSVLVNNKTDVKIIEAVLTKKDPSESLGFSIGKHSDGSLYVKKTVPGGLVTQQHTGLRPGYAILAINGKGSLSFQEACTLLKEEQTIAIRAQKRTFPKGKICRTTVQKIPVGNPLGMTLAKDRMGTIVIKAIAHDSLVYHTGFQCGFILLSVNDCDCEGKTVKEVSEYIAQLPAGEVTLRVKVSGN